MIMRQTVRDYLVDYLNHKITLSQLVDWAEIVMNEGELDPKDAPLLHGIVLKKFSPRSLRLCGEQRGGEMFLDDPGIYYEVHGQGAPLVLLNGIMMNTLSWVDHVARLKDHFQLIIFDMRDQGQSSRLPEGYDNGIHAEDLKKLLDHLKIPKAHLLGLSYGGQVALIFSLKYPERVDRLVLANTSAYVDQYLLSLGEMWKRAARLYDGEAFLTWP